MIKNPKELSLYNKNSQKLPIEEAPANVEAHWNGIYKKHENRVRELWDKEEMHTWLNCRRKKNIKSY